MTDSELTPYVRNQQPVTGTLPALIKNPIHGVELSANQKIEILREQIELIIQQAKKIMDRVEFTKEIYSYNVRFDPVIGHTYYIYERNNKERFVSLISPKEWGSKYNFKHVHTAKFCADDTWEKIDD